MGTTNDLIKQLTDRGVSSVSINCDPKTGKVVAAARNELCSVASDQAADSETALAQLPAKLDEANARVEAVKAAKEKADKELKDAADAHAAQMASLAKVK